MNREERRIRGEDLVPGTQERPGRDVFPLDPAVREEHVEAFEAKIRLDRLDQTEYACLPRIEVELPFLDALTDRRKDVGMHRERVRVLRHPGHLPAVFVGELEVVLRRHGWRPPIRTCEALAGHIACGRIDSRTWSCCKAEAPQGP